ncbi:MAG: TrkH family potassium uptake protein, partial [Chlamydiia bacterium]|nr:TrkH family potassium uptake protein [Chlamydiia bacterium]
MAFREVSHILGRYFFVIALILLIPLGVAAYFEFLVSPDLHPQIHSTVAFLETVGASLLLALGFSWLGRRSKGNVYWKEGLLVVVSIWFLTPLVGSFPFMFSGTLSNPLHGYFEMMSGFTTTGASILSSSSASELVVEETPLDGKDDALKTRYVYRATVAPIRDTEGKVLYTGVEAVGKALLFWRSMTQWLGGIGVIVLFVAIFPALGMGGKMLLHAEVPGPIKDSLTPRIRETAWHLMLIYLSLTVAEVVALMATNWEIDLFEALVTTFSTISTGGYSIYNASIGAFNNPTTEWVVLIFMLAGVVHFTLYFYLRRAWIYKLYNSELLVFLITIFGASLFASLSIVGTLKSSLTGGGIQGEVYSPM